MNGYHMVVKKKCTVCMGEQQIYLLESLGTIQLSYLSIIEDMWCHACNRPAAYLRLVFEVVKNEKDI